MFETIEPINKCNSWCGPVDQTDLVKNTRNCLVKQICGFKLGSHISIQCHRWGESQYSFCTFATKRPKCLVLQLCQTDKVTIWEDTHMYAQRLCNHSISNRTLTKTISKHENSPLSYGERRTAGNNCTAWAATTGAFTGIQLWLLLPESCCSKGGRQMCVRLSVSTHSKNVSHECKALITPCLNTCWLQEDKILLRGGASVWPMLSFEC